MRGKQSTPAAVASDGAGTMMAIRSSQERMEKLVAALSKELEEQRQRIVALEANAGDDADTCTSTSKKRRRGEANEKEIVVQQQKKKKKKKKQQKGRLPDELWKKIFEDVDDDSVMAFASVNKQLRRVQQQEQRRLGRLFGRKLKTSLWKYDNVDQVFYERYFDTLVSEGWCLWAMSLSTEKEDKRMRRITNAAALHGHLNLLKRWKDPELIGQKIIFDKYTCAFAALGGCLEVLNWLRDNDCPWDANTCAAAASGGHLEVLKYAHETGCSWNKETCKAAARGGHLDVLIYLRKNKCPWGKETCKAAARGGHLDVLIYLHKNKCPWDANTCDAAAEEGHLKVLKYAHENGCPWDERTWDAAAEVADLEVLNTYMRMDVHGIGRLVIEQLREVTGRYCNT